MARSKKIVIQSRLGEQTIDTEKVIYFPRGIIGFEDNHEFTLLQIREGAPLLILQSLSDPGLGLLVADPYSFLPEYVLKVGDPEQKLLCMQEAKEATVLVTVSIPAGKPHLTSLNLTGPILINHEKRIGLQIPQADTKPTHVMLESLTQKGIQKTPQESIELNAESIAEDLVQTKENTVILSEERPSLITNNIDMTGNTEYVNAETLSIKKEEQTKEPVNDEYIELVLDIEETNEEKSEENKECEISISEAETEKI